MVIAFPVASATEPLVEAFVSLVESQGGIGQHHVLISHTPAGEELAKVFAARLAPHCKGAEAIGPQLKTVQEANGLVYSALHVLRQKPVAAHMLWLDPGILPTSVHSFDLMVSALSMYPQAAIITGMTGEDIIVFSVANLGRNTGIAKMPRSATTDWRTLAVSYVPAYVVRIPALTVGDGAGFFERAGKTAPKGKPATKQAKPQPVEEAAPAEESVTFPG